MSAPTGNERFDTAARTGVCPDCGRRVFTPDQDRPAPAAQILAAHSCTGVR